MNKTIAIKDLIAPVVVKVSDIIYPPGPDQTNAITFLHGHPLEIIETLNQYNLDPVMKEKKYPLVALFQDFKETMNPRIGVYADVSLNMIIANFTEPGLKASERYERNFYTILFPIYQELIRKLNKSGYFMGYQDATKHDKWDRLFWGRDGLYGKTGNIFNDFIDAIEIQNLNLSIDQKICKSWQS